ncbi:alpha-glucosidase [Dysgonomonas alginatilytica]|uniref:Alpha-glucosidase n=1 Tax=Dysgonomonas alginatilytica TaxID=1605892 RepID=A0A2V3PP83_9BACT|nr:glycoside hydrolase family 97 catalytic domain-containing protein [Dysgonomonas alginatilytica]PXV65026.1 alpha-glucosidase [Dysgonomonas alginatilytica]
MKTKIRFVAYSLLLLFSAQFVQATQYIVQSPNKALTIKVDIGQDITYSVECDNVELIKPSLISIALNNGITIGKNGTVSNSSSKEVKGDIPLVYGKNKTMEENYNETTIDFDQNYSLIVRAYDEGVAYRFRTRLGGDVVVNSEQAEFNFSGTPTVWYPEADQKMESWERVYTFHNSIAEIPSGSFSITPAMFSYPTGIRVVIAESDLSDYPGMYIQPSGTNAMKGKWAQYPKTVTDPNDVYKYHRVTERYDYLARTSGTRTYPWRVVIVSEEDKDLLNNELIFKLAKTQEIINTDWIQPGKSVWEWWHDGILEGVNPSGTLSYESYKYYIDYAAANKIEYLTMDAGWSDSFVVQVCNYAKSKNVKVILWDFINLPVTNPNRITQLKNYGAAGVKIDLIERDDQIAMNWIEKLAKDCADREMLLVLHGCPKPTGLQRAYPNIINFEAVRGAECDKWDTTPNADYHLQFPFIRMLAGPLDYTPGSMRNKHLSQFTPIGTGVPMSIGTRAHELAMYVMFDQPMGYLCDSPIEYAKYKNISEFFSHVPTVWDKTLPLDAEVGEYAVIAKKNANEWFVGGMTNSKGRQLEVSFDFLDAGKPYEIQVYRDNDNTDNDATAYTYETLKVTSESKVKFKLSPEGGFALRVTESSTSGIEKETLDNGFLSYTKHSQLYIQAPELLRNIWIYDITGRLSFQKTIAENNVKEYTLNIEELNKGVHLLRVETENNHYSNKFIK